MIASDWRRRDPASDGRSDGVPAGSL